MPVILERKETVCLVQLEGEVAITSAKELKEILLQALGCGTELRVDLERATELDVTTVQLLWAAEREARASGRGFTFAGRVPEEISAAMADAGLEKFPVEVEAK